MVVGQEQWESVGTPPVITEKHFSLSHAGFWQQLLPTASSYLRECNGGAARFELPLSSNVSPRERGVVNETGFRLFAAAVVSGREPALLPDSTVKECVALAISHIGYMREFHRTPPTEPGRQGLAEAVEIASRLVGFCRRLHLADVSVLPKLPGCGWLDSCRADMHAKEILFEVKAGDRRFHSSDFRQLLCYCALNFSSKTLPVETICLVNPRTGRYFADKLEHVCQRMSGRSSIEVLSDIVTYISEPLERPQGVY